MRARYIFEWFPRLIEEEISEATIKKYMSEYEEDLLKDEVGLMLLGELYKPHGQDNPELPSRLAGMMGQEVKKWKTTITSEKITNNIDKTTK